MKNTAKYISLLLAALTSLSLLSGCGRERKSPGSGIEGVVEKHDWSAYDELIERTKSESDPLKREQLFHQAEDMVMEACAVIPINYASYTMVKKPTVSGDYVTPLGMPVFSRIEKEGSNTVRIQFAAEPKNMDYTVSSTVDGAALGELIGEGLAYSDAEGNIILKEAESITVSDDGLDYTIELKKNLKWSDGTRHDANDYVYSWKRCADPASGCAYSNLFSYIDGYPDNLNVSASDDGNTFFVHLKEPCMYFTDLIARANFFPVQPSYLESAPGYRDKNGNMAAPSVWATEAGFPSNGPYILKEWRHDQNMVFVKNPEYYDAASIKTDKIEFMLSTDASVAYAAYSTGDLDYTSFIPSDEIPNLIASGEYHSKPIAGINYLTFNVASDMFAGFTWEEACTFRRALCYIIDRQFIIDVVLQGHQTAANTIVTPLMSASGTGREFRQNTESYTYPCKEQLGYFPVEPDYDRAREMLKSIGFVFDDDGKLETPFYIEYVLNSASTNIDVAACIQQDLAQLGFVMTLKTEDFNVFLADTRAGNFQTARGGWYSDFSDPIGMLEMFCSNNANNAFQLGK